MSKTHLDNPRKNDNRKYDYSGFESIERPEYNFISKFVSLNSSILDLACGNGTLLEKLQREKNCRGKGLELSQSAVNICLKKNLDVLLKRIDEPLPFADNEFDYAVCNVTIQMVMYPEILVSEMKRVSKHLIISFPNFAFYKNRIDYFLHGRMPKPMLFGYRWFNTGHIHQFSVKDFHQLLESVGGLNVISIRFVPSKNRMKNYLMKLIPNLFQYIPIFLLEKRND